MTHPARRVYPRSAHVGMVARDFPQNPHALSSTNINLIIRRCWLPYQTVLASLPPQLTGGSMDKDWLNP